MAEQVIKKYFCDFCGAEIDQRSESAIRCFDRGRNSKDGFVVKQLPQLTDATREVYVVIEAGDFCNVDHFAQHIKERMDKSRGRGATDE